VKRALRDIPVVTITGPRQSGKTTLVKSLAKGYSYANLEYLDERERALMDPRAFLEGLGDRAIIDEAQLVPELFSYIQGRVDEVGRNGMYVLSGSQNFHLMERVTQSLSGRTYLHELLPLSAAELHAADLLPEDVDEFILKGGYPRLYDQQEQADTWKRAYLRTYAERDVRQVLAVRDLASFSRFLALCAGRSGQLLNMASLANDAGIDVKTAQHWLGVLETSYLVFLLKPHHRNFNKRIIKAPKLFFFDTGLACTLLGIRSTKELRFHPLRGHLFETMVIAELWKNRLNEGEEPGLWYWRDSQGHEVDAILDSADGLTVFEIKASATVSSALLDGLRYHRTQNKNQGSYTLVHAGQGDHRMDGMRVMGWREALTAG
jgi:predicted AAA+ superfamily ATPase